MLSNLTHINPTRTNLSASQSNPLAQQLKLRARVCTCDHRGFMDVRDRKAGESSDGSPTSPDHDRNSKGSQEDVAEEKNEKLPVPEPANPPKNRPKSRGRSKSKSPAGGGGGGHRRHRRHGDKLSPQPSEKHRDKSRHSHRDVRHSDAPGRHHYDNDGGPGSYRLRSRTRSSWRRQGGHGGYDGSYKHHGSYNYGNNKAKDAKGQWPPRPADVGQTCGICGVYIKSTDPAVLATHQRTSTKCAKELARLEGKEDFEGRRVQCDLCGKWVAPGPAAMAMHQNSEACESRQAASSDKPGVEPSEKKKPAEPMKWNLDKHAASSSSGPDLSDVSDLFMSLAKIMKRK